MAKKKIETYPPRERLKRMCFQEYNGGICCVCGGWYYHGGHNPAPVVNDKDSRCCSDCNKYTVIPTRMVEHFHGEDCLSDENLRNL